MYHKNGMDRNHGDNTPPSLLELLALNPTFAVMFFKTNMIILTLNVEKCSMLKTLWPDITALRGCT